MSVVSLLELMVFVAEVPGFAPVERPLSCIPNKFFVSEEGVVATKALLQAHVVTVELSLDAEDGSDQRDLCRVSRKSYFEEWNCRKL